MYDNDFSVTELQLCAQLNLLRFCSFVACKLQNFVATLAVAHDKKLQLATSKIRAQQLCFVAVCQARQKQLQLATGATVL